MAAASASDAYPSLQRSSWSLVPLAPPSRAALTVASELGPLNHPAIQLLLLRKDEKRHARQQKEQKEKKRDGLSVT